MKTNKILIKLKLISHSEFEHNTQFNGIVFGRIHIKASHATRIICQQDRKYVVVLVILALPSKLSPTLNEERNKPINIEE
jgi:hypothetical protein